MCILTRINILLELNFVIINNMRLYHTDIGVYDKRCCIYTKSWMWKVPSCDTTIYVLPTTK